MTQAEQILRHLQQGNAITPLTAQTHFDCGRLSARIKDLRRNGHNIKTTMIRIPSGKRVACYSLEE